MKDLCQQHCYSKMGTEIIPGLLDPILKATSERREFGKGKEAVFTVGTKARSLI